MFDWQAVFDFWLVMAVLLIAGAYTVLVIASASEQFYGRTKIFVNILHVIVFIALAVATTLIIGNGGLK